MSERGTWTFGPIVGTIIVILAIVGFFVVCTDDPDEEDLDGLGRVELVSHDYGGYECYGHDDCGYEGDEYDGNRGNFSPGPFDRSPIDMRNACISLDCSGRERDDRERADEPPADGTAEASLFPPTPEGVRDFVLNTIKGGIEMGRLFAETTIKFVENLLIGLA